MAAAQQHNNQHDNQQDSQHGGGIIEWRERNYVCNHVFFQCPGMSRSLDSATPGRPPKVPFFGRERYVFMFYVRKIVPVDTLSKCLKLSQVVLICLKLSQSVSGGGTLVISLLM